MRSHASLAALALVHGSVALPANSTSGRNFTLPLGPALQQNHVIDQLPESLRALSCYQRNDFQTFPDGKNVKFPCVSEQEIVGYCHQMYSDDRPALANCLFADDSTYKSDYVCCIACRNQYGDGYEGTVDQAKLYVQELQKNFTADPKPDFRTLTAAVKQSLKIEPNYDLTATVKKGVDQLDIRDYCPSPQTPQHAGSPKPKSEASTTSSESKPKASTTSVGSKTEASTTSGGSKTMAPTTSGESMPKASTDPLAPKVDDKKSSDNQPDVVLKSNPVVFAGVKVGYTGANNKTVLAPLWMTYDITVNVRGAAPALSSSKRVALAQLPESKPQLVLRDRETKVDKNYIQQVESAKVVTYVSIDGCGCLEKGFPEPLQRSTVGETSFSAVIAQKLSISINGGPARVDKPVSPNRNKGGQPSGVASGPTSGAQGPISGAQGPTSGAQGDDEPINWC